MTTEKSLELNNAAINRAPLLLAMSLCTAALVCIGQIVASTAVVAFALIMLLVICVLSCATDEALPVLLFYLPWSPLLKLSRGSISFFTIAILLICGLYFIKNKLYLDLYQIVLTGAIIVLTLVGKAIQDTAFANSYFVFIVMLLFFPCVTKGAARGESFAEMTTFFALGIISAALSAQYSTKHPTIAQYITVDSYLTITRLSGYYGDPNFYSAQITACLAGVQLLLIFEDKKGSRILFFILGIVLIYCGLLSASKSYIVVLAALFLVWIFIVLSGKHLSRSWQLLIAAACAALVAFSSSQFQSLLRIVDTRFSYASNVSELTTGRTDIWKMYIDELMRNVSLNLFGQGYSMVNLNGRASHNTIIQSIYQFGLIGTPFMLAWIYLSLKSALPSFGAKRIRFKYALLMGIGIILPWMALDLLFFDEFFLLPVYGLIGVVYASERSR